MPRIQSCRQRYYVLHNGYLSPNKSIDLSPLRRPGYYKVVAVAKTRRNPKGTTIHVSKEMRDEINAVGRAAFAATGNRLNQDDIIAHLLAAYKHTGANLCYW